MNRACLVLAVMAPIIMFGCDFRFGSATGSDEGVGTGNGGADVSAGSLALNATVFDVSEGDTLLNVTVNRLEGDAGSVNVDFTTIDGSARAGVDYQATSGTLAFSDGTTSRTFSVGIDDDTEAQGSRSFTLSLSNATGGATVADPSTSLVIIVDDDAASRGSLQLDALEITVAEDAGSETIPVIRTGGEEGTVTVNFATSDETAIAGEDYNATAGTLTFEDGETSKDLSVEIIDDDIVEEDETFNVALSSPAGGATLSDPVRATVTIEDNDLPPLSGSLRLEAPSFTVSESDGVLSVTVERISNSLGNVAVDFATRDGTARAGVDYEAAAGMLTFGDAVTSRSFTVGIIASPEAESDKTFTVSLSNPTGGATLASPTNATATILDETDAPETQLYDFELLQVDISIGNQDNWVFSEGSAVVARDLTPVNGTLTVQTSNGGGLSTDTRITRSNDEIFSFTPLSGTQAVTQFELTGEATALFALGSDLNSDGFLDPTDRELGPAFGVFDGKFIVKQANLGEARLTSDLGNGNSPRDWFRLQLRMDFQANGGNGTGSLDHINLSNNETTFTPVEGLQNINLNLSSLAPDALPATWNAMFLQLISGANTFASADNLRPNVTDLS